MEYHFRVIYNNEKITFIQAIDKKYISITDYGLKIQNDKIQLCESSGLYDANMNEIFENDILVSIDNKHYQVKKYVSTFFICEINGNKGSIPISLYSLKNNKVIDNLILKN